MHALHKTYNFNNNNNNNNKLLLFCGKLPTLKRIKQRFKKKTSFSNIFILRKQWIFISAKRYIKQKFKI